jgi:23S rRNA (cytosine1962-C5)-methyltransferase
MNLIPKVILKPGKEAALKRFHPWVFSGAIRNIMGRTKPGDLVEVYTAEKEYLGTGFYEEGSIAVKVFSFVQQEVNEEFWIGKLRQAFGLRQRLQMTESPSTNAYRLVFSEGDSLPGLIIDYYNGVCVIQTHSIGMHNLKPVLVKGLKEIYGDGLKAVYDKSAETMQHSMDAGGNRDPEAKLVVENHYLYGDPQPVEILETGHRFMVQPEKGQKTGFFLDQRANRMFAQYYGKGRTVLNTFCYSGAFSVYALKGGATMVHSVDSSRQAIEWTEENMKLNGFGEDRQKTFVADAKRYLAATKEKYDLIILDPPAFAKSHAVSNNALHAYIHINAEALKRLNPGGLLFTFSCSQAISRETFQSAIVSASLEAGRDVRILHQLSQGADHPVSIWHPEGMYLKGHIVVADH